MYVRNFRTRKDLLRNWVPTKFALLNLEWIGLAMIVYVLNLDTFSNDREKMSRNLRDNWLNSG